MSFRVPSESRLGDSPRQADAFDRLLAWGAWPWLLVMLAIAFRLGRYLQNPAIWLDEAMLVPSILDRNLWGLLEPLEHHQKAPFGFLAAVRGCAVLCGTSEYALRLVPLLASVAAPVLFYVLLRRLLDREPTVIALALFAISGPLITYAAEVKQYSLDVVATLVIVLGAVSQHAETEPADPPSAGASRLPRMLWFAAWALAGSAAVWFSHAAVFVLAGTGAALGLHALVKKNWRGAIRIALAAMLWIASFVGMYFATLREGIADSMVRSWWTHAFMPLPPSSPSDVKWFLDTFFEVFRDPIGIPAAGLAATLFLAGGVSAWRRSPWTASVLLLPVAFALLASGLELYPFRWRFLLFAVPLLVPFIAHGFDVLRRAGCPAWVRGIVLAVLLLQPALEAMDDLLMPDTPQGVRPVVQHIKTNYQPGDRIYVHHWASFSFRHYMRHYGCEFEQVTDGVSSRNDWSYYLGAIEQFRGSPRVWFVFVPIDPALGAGEEQFFRTTLDRLGTRLDTLQTKGSSAYLYAL